MTPSDAALIAAGNSWVRTISLGYGTPAGLAAMRAALASPQPAPTVSDGWRLVPVEPTPEMVTAGQHVREERGWSAASLIYRTMLAAAPKPAAALAIAEKSQPTSAAVMRAMEGYVRQQAADKTAKDSAHIKAGRCPECEGDGQQGGQFCGGYWTCDSCKGTGAAPQEPQR